MRRIATLMAIGLLSSGLSHVNATPVDRDTETTVLVHLLPAADLRSAVDSALDRGLTVSGLYPSIGVFAVVGSSSSINRLTRLPEVDYLEDPEPLELMTDTSHVATRAQAVLEGAMTLPDGTPIDGREVGVAIVDGGIDGTHPDLADRMAANLRIYCVHASVGPVEAPCEFVPMSDTDHVSAGGHGTHIAGIVAGTGQASGGRFRGSAPRASLYGLSVGVGLTFVYALEAFQWILDNHDKVNPPIRVVNNSYGGQRGKPDPDRPDAFTKMQMALLLEAGVTLVWAAGNSGGDGSRQQTSIECTLLTPGNICVGNYDDLGTGSRESSLSNSSSRGLADDPETWLDLSAPGMHITSSCRLTLPICSGEATHEREPPNRYAAISGTSMATPHVAGIVAMLYQVDPLLRPGEVEWVLEETAHEFSAGAPFVDDPMHPGRKSSFDKGHGLVDALAAVRAVMDPLEVSSPANGDSVDTSFEVTGRIWYGDTVEIAVDGERVATLEDVRQFWSHRLSGLGAGTHEVAVTLFSGTRAVRVVNRTVTVS